MEKLALNEKYMLSINEAGAYFNISVKKIFLPSLKRQNILDSAEESCFVWRRRRTCPLWQCTELAS